MATHPYFTRTFRLIASVAAIAMIGCSAPLVKMPEPTPSIVRQHASVRVTASYPGLKKTGIYLNKGDFYTVLVDGEVNTNPKRYPGRWQGAMTRMRLFAGDLPISKYAFNNIQQSYHEGEIAFIVSDGPFNYGKKQAMNPKWYQSNVGSFRVTVFIWEKDDYRQIASFLDQLHAADPENEVLGDIAKTAAHYRDIQVVENNTNKQVAETREMIEQLKTGTTESKVRSDTQVARLESKLAALQATLTELDQMKKTAGRRKRKIGSADPAAGAAGKTRKGTAAANHPGRQPAAGDRCRFAFVRWRYRGKNRSVQRGGGRRKGTKTSQLLPK